MTAYYNTIDPFDVQWLKNLIDDKQIAYGVVDDRSVEDVRPSDVAGFTQCHFFAGIGLWSLALRRAGWADNRRVWTGSCPCQPFSTAGEGKGFADERHLWPSWFHLIEQCNPEVVFGEQVASKDGLGWFDLVSADLEGAGFAVGQADLCAAGFGAFHIRQRLWFVANSYNARSQGWGVSAERTGQLSARAGGLVDGVADADDQQYERAVGSRRWGDEPSDNREIIWIPCLDGKSRPTEPGIFPLADGHPGRVGMLRAYGNGIHVGTAEAFIRAAIE